MISFKDYAEQKNISYEAVRKQVRRYGDELEGHIHKINRAQYLDDYAVEFLDAKRNEYHVFANVIDYSAEIEQLKLENHNLTVKIAAQADQIATLSVWKADNAMLIAESSFNGKLLEEKTKEVELLEGFLKDAKENISAAEKEKKEVEEKLREEIQRLQTELQEEKSRKWKFPWSK